MIDTPNVVGRKSAAPSAASLSTGKQARSFLKKSSAGSGTKKLLQTFSYQYLNSSLRAKRSNPETRRRNECRRSFSPRRIVKLIVLLSVLLPPSAAFATPLSTIPFVGCADTGMTAGPAPTAPPIHIDLPPSVAQKLAVYAGVKLALLAPRGWKCAAQTGTSGSILSAFPGPAYLDSGPAVVITSVDGGNPGAEDVVILFGGRFFPKFISRDDLNAFRSAVSSNQSTPEQPFIFPIRPRDHITYISPTILTFETPAFYPGLGASLIPNAMSAVFDKPRKFRTFRLMRIFTQGGQAFAIETVATSLPAKEFGLTKAIVNYAKACLIRYTFVGNVPYCGISANYPEAGN